MSEPKETNIQDLNPALRAVLDQLGSSRDNRPVFAEDIGNHIRRALETAAEPYLSDLPPNQDLFLSKHELGQIHGCQTKYMAERDEEFEWAVNIARGSIVHKAVELSMNWRKEIDPSVLVDESLARYEQDSGSLGYWLQGCSEVERAELRSESLAAFTKFLECWPPLKPAWRPVSESRLRAELCNGKLVLSGRADLTLGTPDGFRAGKVIIDLKTGNFAPLHVEDLRFYALIETLRMGVPPRLLATYYLDSAQFSPEEVTEELLMSTVARVIDGIEKYSALIYKNQVPKEISGPQCRWCGLLESCSTGALYLEESL